MILEVLLLQLGIMFPSTATLEKIQHLLGTLRVTDFLDLLIITLFVYTLFLFVRRMRSTLVFWGFGITLVLYYLAQTFDLYLTFVALRYFAGVALIIFAIIFQSEIKKYVEVLGLIGSRQLKVGKLAPKSPHIEGIIQACVQMAQAKTGAIIVIQADSDLTDIVEGGVKLDGVVSEELLMSIFFPKSPGHDGAVIISNSRVHLFGAQLPLSTNFKEIGKHGTRHSAALGLSEVSDALCIVCSEEKGTISIAKDGKLKTLDDYNSLEKEIAKYLRTKELDNNETLLKHFLTHNTSLKIAALFLSVFIWTFAVFQAGTFSRTFAVPVNMQNIPSDSVFESYSPKQITLTIEGRGDTSLNEFSPQDFKVNIDASSIQTGVTKLQIAEKDIELPPNLDLVSYSPDSILINSLKYYTATVPVIADLKGTPQEGLVVASVAIIPSQVEIQVPDGTAAPSELKTELIDLSKLKETLIKPVKLVVPRQIRIKDNQIEVNVAITIEKQ